MSALPSAKRRAVITGAGGQLGSALAEAMADAYDVVALTREDLDVTDDQRVVQEIGQLRPAVVLNATAYNDVDGAEERAAHAMAINALAVRSLARAAEASGATLVHYSTDFVFDGEIDRPYVEQDPPSPRSVYAQSKLVGEWMAAATPRHYVLRVESLFGGQQARSSIDKFIVAFRQRREVQAFHDREVSPSYAVDVATATLALIEKRAAHGVYHCVNSGHATWLEVARTVAAALGLADPNIVAVSVNDVRLRASRPRYAALDNGKLRAVGIAMPSWQDALARYVARLDARRQ